MIKVAIFGHFMAANRRVDDIDPQIFFFSLYYVKFTNANETLIQPISFTAAQKKQKTKQNNNTKSIEISCFCEFLCFNQFFFCLGVPFSKKNNTFFFGLTVYTLRILFGFFCFITTTVFFLPFFFFFNYSVYLFLVQFLN